MHGSCKKFRISIKIFIVGNFDICTEAPETMKGKGQLGTGGPRGSSVPEGHDGRNGIYEDEGIGSRLHPHELYLQVWLGLVQ